MDNLSNLLLEVETGFLSNPPKETLAVFLDINGAFNNVIPQHLLDILAELDVPIETILFANHLISCRQIFSEFNPHSPRFSVKGTPQGGVLSPLFFSVYIKDISKGIPDEVNISLFADDTGFYFTSSNTELLHNVIQSTLNILRQNLSKLGLSLNPEKTQVIKFSKNKYPSIIPPIILDNTALPYLDRIKFLGVWFDSKLSFEHQVNHVVSRVTVSKNILKFLCGTWWGSDPNTLIILYKSLIRSKIDYALPIYFPLSPSLVRKLEQIQYSSLRIAMGYRNSTPLNVIREETKLSSIADRAELLSLNYVTKAISSLCNISAYKIHEIINIPNPSKSKRKLSHAINTLKPLKDTLLTDFPKYFFLLDFHHTFLPPLINIVIPRSKSFPTILAQAKANLCSCFFTDGSLVPNSPSVGYAVAKEDGFVWTGTLPPETSIFTAELAAIDKALDFCHNNPHETHIIFSDSQSALQSLAAPISNRYFNPFAISARQKIYNILSTNHNPSPINFCWVPSHSGYGGNEIADHWARTVTRLPPDTFRIPATDFKRSWKTLIKEKSRNKNILESQVKGRYYFENSFNSGSKPWFNGFNFSRRTTVTINRLRANHHSLGESLARKNIIQDPSCECGHPLQDLDHVLWTCPIHQESRTHFERQLRRMGHNPPIHSSRLLKVDHPALLSALSRFLQEANLNA